MFQGMQVNEPEEVEMKEIKKHHEHHEHHQNHENHNVSGDQIASVFGIITHTVNDAPNGKLSGDDEREKEDDEKEEDDKKTNRTLVTLSRWADIRSAVEDEQEKETSQIEQEDDSKGDVDEPVE